MKDRRRKEAEDNLKQEVAQVNRLKGEIEQERKNMIEKKR